MPIASQVNNLVFHTSAGFSGVEAICDDTKITYYIYTLSSPEEIENVRYVGYTKNPKQRLATHSNSYKTGHGNKVKNWIKSLNSKGIKPVMSVIDSIVGFDNVNELEIAYIKLYKTIGANLKNLTQGGKGTYGFKYSEEQRMKIIEREGYNQFKIKEKRRAPKKYKPVKDEIVAQMFYGGKLFKDIAVELDVPISFINEVSKRMNWSYTDERPRFVIKMVTKSEIEEVYIYQNKPRKEASEILGMTERNLKKKLKDFGIKKTKEQSMETKQKEIDKRKAISNELTAIIIKENNNGLKKTEIAKKYNIKVELIYDLFKRIRKDEKNIH